MGKEKLFLKYINNVLKNFETCFRQVDFLFWKDSQYPNYDLLHSAALVIFTEKINQFLFQNLSQLVKSSCLHPENIKITSDAHQNSR